MLDIEFYNKDYTLAKLYEIDFVGSMCIREYDLCIGWNRLIIPISQEDWDFTGCDGGYFIELSNVETGNKIVLSKTKEKVI